MNSYTRTYSTSIASFQTPATLPPLISINRNAPGSEREPQYLPSVPDIMCHRTSRRKPPANSLIHTSPSSETTSSSNAGRRLGCSACAMLRRKAASRAGKGNCATRRLIHSSISRSSMVKSMGPSRIIATGPASRRVTRISNSSAVPRYKSCPDTPMVVRCANGAIPIVVAAPARPTTTSVPGRGPTTSDNSPVRSYRKAR